MPTEQPTTQPTQSLGTVPPSPSPASAPSISPTEGTSAVPTEQPSSITLIASAEPSAVPSLASSVISSSPPSIFTSSPSAVLSYSPSLRPVNGDSSYESSAAYANFNNLQSAIVEIVPKGVYPYVFSAFNYLGNTIVGSCNEWETFILTNLGFQQNEQFLSAIQASFGNEITEIESGTSASVTNNVICSNSVVASNLASNMYSGNNYDAVCDNGHLWRTFSCSNGGTVLCVDCPLSCFSQSCAGNQSMILNPCQNALLCQNYTSSRGLLVTSYGVIRFDKVISIPYPIYLSPLTYTSAQNQLSITTNISGPGIVYCAAYKNESNFFPSSFSDIASSGYYATFVGSHSAVVTVDVLSLEPDTYYRVYCATSDFNANVMGITMIRAYELVAPTACCKSIVFDTPSNTEIVSTSNLQSLSSSPFTFHLNAQPTATETIQIVVSSLQSCIYTPLHDGTIPTVSPAVFTFAPGSTFFTGSFVVFGSVGCYSLQANSLSKEFQSAQLKFNIRNATTPPSPPKLSSAVMSNDGLQISLGFDSQTDTAKTVISNYNAQFSCSLILFFKNKTVTSSCQWQSLTTLVVVLSVATSSDNAVSIGDFVQVLPNKIKAYCSSVSIADCTSYLYAANTSTLSALVGAPLMPIMPYASLNGPNSAWVLSPLFLDPTASTGSGPQPWLEFTWGVSSSEWSPQNVSMLAQYLQTNFQTTLRLVNIPGGYVFPGSFNISLTLTNVFGKSSYAELNIRVQVEKTVPLVSILGPQVISLYRSQPINLASNVTFSYVLNDSQKVYDWSLYDGLVYLQNLRSTSVNKKYFSLPTYALDASKVYTLSLTVYSKSFPSQVAQASTRLSVGQSGVIAKISGGTSRSVNILDNIYLNAYESFDLDYPSSSLNYTWSCVELSPKFQDPCKLYSGLLSSKNNEVQLHLVPDSGSTLNSSYVYNFSLTVTNKRGSSASAYTTLTLLPDSSPMMSIQTASKYDVGKKIIISGNVLNSDANRPATVSWSLDGINLTASVLTPRQSTINANTAAVFQLSLKPFTFSPGKTYTLRLSASNSYFSSAFVEALIVINMSPYGGQLSVVPKKGFEFNTTYSLTTSLWLSPADNYPLTYSFAYYDLSVDSQVHILQSQSSIVPYVNSILSKGLSSTNFSVYCIAYVSDIYGSSSNTTTTVQVFRAASRSASYSLYSQALQLAATGGDSSAIVSAVVTISNSISSSDCALAPNCSALNRMYCKNTANTCGPCYSRYVGVDGDANSVCAFPASILKIGATCSSSSSCISGNCVGKVCIDSVKECPNNCSGSGVCSYYSYYGRSQLQNCFSGDTSCYARCNCSADSFGSDCLQSISTLDAARILRESLCSALFQSLQSQDVFTSVIASRATTVSNIMTDFTLLTQKGFEMCTNVMLVSLFEYPLLSADNAVVSSMINAFNNVLSMGSEIPPALLSNISEALSLLSTSRQSLLATGEEPSTFSTSTLSMLTVKDSLSTVGAVTYPSPQSAYNAFNNKPNTQASVGSISNRNARLLATSTSTTVPVLGINLVQYKNNPTGSSNLFSNIVLETKISSGVDSTTSIATQVTLQSLTNIDYSSYSAKVQQVPCPLQSIASNITITCANGVKYDALCPASTKSVAVNFSCPSFTRHPQCTALNGTNFKPNMDCIAIQYSSLSTTCQCTLPSNGNFSADISASYRDASGVGSYNIVAIAPTVNYGRSAIIAITTAVLSLSLIFAYFMRFRWNYLSTNEKDKDKRKQQYSKTKSKNLGRTFKSFFEKCIPIEFTEHPNFESFLSTLFFDHTYFNGFFVFPSKQENRDTFLYAVSRILNHIALDTLIVIYFFDDTFSPCSHHYSESRCHSYSHLLSKVCQWDSQNNSCFYTVPSISFVNIIVVVVVVLILSIPLEKMSQFLVSLFLEALVSKKVSPKTLNDTGAEIVDDFEVHANIDELELVQNRKNTIIRAAAFARMQTNIDSISPIAELNYLIERKHVYQPEGNIEEQPKKRNSYYQFYTSSGAPYTRTGFLQDTSPASRRSIIHKLKNCRSDATSIHSELSKLSEDGEKDLYLMKHFLANFLSGYKSTITNSALFKRKVSALNSSTALKLVALFSLPLYCFGVLVFTINFGLQIHDAVAVIWIICGVIAIVEDGFWILPAMIYLKTVAIPGLAKNDFLAVLYVISSRAKSILSRETFYIMNNSQALIQHFHPACRAARSVPHLAVSRLLMSITDYDLPISHLLGGQYPMLRRWNGKPLVGSLGHISKWFHKVMEAFIIIYLGIPQWLQLSTLELLSAIVLNGVVIALYLCSLVSIGLVVAITVITAGLCILGLYYLFPDIFLYAYMSTSRKHYYPAASSDSNLDLEDLRGSNPNDVFVDSNLVYENRDDDVAEDPRSTSSHRVDLQLRLKPVFGGESNLAFGTPTDMRIKPDVSLEIHSSRSSSEKSEQRPRIETPGKTYCITVDNPGSDDKKSFDDAAFFESPAAYVYSRKSAKLSAKKPNAPVSPRTQSKGLFSPQSRARDVISVEKARKIRAIIRESSKQQSRRLKELTVDTSFQKAAPEDGEEKQDGNFSDSKYDELSRPDSTRSQSGKRHFGTPASQLSKSPHHKHLSEDESSPNGNELIQMRKQAIRNRLSQNRKKSDRVRSAIAHPLSAEELAQKIAALSSIVPGAEPTTTLKFGAEKSTSQEDGAPTNLSAKRTKSTSVSFAVDMLPSSPLHLRPFKHKSNPTVSNPLAMQLSNGPNLSNSSSSQSPELIHTAAPTTDDISLSIRPGGETKSPIYFRPLRNRNDESELHVVTIQSPGVDRNESNLDNIFRETIGSNKSDIVALRTAILSPDSTYDSIASPTLSDIRSPNLNRIKLEPLGHSTRRHRKKISTLQERSKQLMSQSQPSGVGSISLSHPLDAAARRNLIMNSLSKDLVGEKEGEAAVPALKREEELNSTAVLQESNTDEK